MNVAARDLSPAEALGLSLALGLALFTVCLFVFYFAGMSGALAVWPAFAITLGGLWGGLRVLRQARQASTEERLHDLLTPYTLEDYQEPALWSRQGALKRLRLGVGPLLYVLGLGMAIAQVLLSGWMALRSPFATWDAWSVWTFKAEMFVEGSPPLAYFHDPVTLYTHPDYPLNLPLAESALLRFGALGSDLAALIGPACLGALLLLLYAGLARLHGHTLAAAATGVFALLPALSGQAAGGDADLPLALYAGAAALYLLLWWRLRRRSDLILMGLLAGGAAWTKKEGLALAVLICVACAAGEALRRDRRATERLPNTVLAVVTTITLPLPWLLFSRVEQPLGRDFWPVSPPTFLAHADRLPHIVASIGLQMLDFANWSLLWVVLAGTLLMAIRHRIPGHVQGLLALLVGQLAFYSVIFVFSDWQPYTAHVQTALDRLLLQATPLAFLLLTESLFALTAAPATEMGNSVLDLDDAA